MRIALVCPSNMLYMPYVDNYIKVLNEANVDYDIINWDRFNIEDKNNTLKYRDKKIGHQRNFLDYYEYYRFIIRCLNMERYDKIIVFGIQLTFFLQNILRKKYKKKYIIDIRDYNKIINYFNIGKIVNNSSFVALSSQGYKEWLPDSNKYMVNHNTQIENFEEFKKPNIIFNKKKVRIAYIGAIRDYQVNIDFINSLRNTNLIDVFFHGEGDVNKDIQDYLDSKSVENVYLTGRYNAEDEKKLYEDNDLINVLRYNDGINNKTALPNRLYNAALFGKPMIALSGTYLAEIINNYKLGLVLNSLENIGGKIEEYLKDFDSEAYNENRIDFFSNVIEDNYAFLQELKKFTQ